MTASIMPQKNHPMPDESSMSSSDYKEFFSGYSYTVKPHVRPWSKDDNDRRSGMERTEPKAL